MTWLEGTIIAVLLVILIVGIGNMLRWRVRLVGERAKRDTMREFLTLVCPCPTHETRIDLGQDSLEEIRMKLRGLMQVGAVVLFLSGAGQVWAQVAGEPIGEVCARMLPFDDVITLDVVQLAVPPGVPAFFTFAAYWLAAMPDGSIVYEMPGSGSAGYNPTFDVYSLDIVLRNIASFAFGANTNCKLTAIIDGSMNGPWAIQCIGRTPPTQGGTPYFAQGTFAPMECPAPETMVASMQGREFLTVGPQGQLAGVER